MTRIASRSSLVVTLDRAARVALGGDGVLALVLGISGLVTASAQADLTGLPVELLLASSVALIPYGARALQAGRGREASRARVEGLVLFNLVWLVALTGLLFGGWLQPTAVGVAVLAGHAAIPATVAFVVARTLRGRSRV